MNYDYLKSGLPVPLICSDNIKDEQLYSACASSIVIFLRFDNNTCRIDETSKGVVEGNSKLHKIIATFGLDF